MAANFQPTTATFLSALILLIIISNVPQSFSQSNSPQNIQTFYPFSPPPPSPPEVILPPPPPVNDPPALPPPTTTTPPSKSSTRSAVGRAIGVTAATTLVLSGLLFFFLLRRSRRKRETNSIPATATHGGTDSPVSQNDNFMRFNGNLKGVIVDENGLDVLYWRNLEEGENRNSFKKQYYKNLKDEEKEEEKRVVSNRERRSKPPVQEAPLLRGKSSTSQSPIWDEKDQDHMIKKLPSLSNGIALKAVEKQDTSVLPAAPPAVVGAVPTVKMAASPPPPPPPPLAVGAVPMAKKAAAPPPPPPPPLAVGAVPMAKMAAAPPPPPPPLAVGAVPMAKMAAAPPPPPPPLAAPPRPSPNKGPVPPLPLPPGGPSKRSSSLGEGGSSKENGPVKLKPLHWDKVNPNVEHSVVWDKIDKGSFKFDGDLMEALFGYVATNRKSPQRDTRSRPQTAEKSQIFILDMRKSQNIAIVLKSLGISRNAIIDALVEGHGLNADTIEKLTRIAPTGEEASQILTFDGDPTKLADAESFLYHLLEAVPSAFSRFNAMLFRSNYDSEVSQIKESLQSLESACKELRTRGLFLKLLEAILKAGNRLNAGTSRGNAQAFNLTALRKLSDVKSSDGKTTLLQFVVQEVVRAEGKRCVLNRNRSLSRTNSQSSDQSVSTDDSEREYMMLGLPVIGGLSAEFSNVKKVADLDYDLLIKTISALESQVHELRKEVAKYGPDEGFAREMNGFLDTAELEIKILKDEQVRVLELVKKTTDYYQAGSLKDKGGNPLQLFIIVRDFLGMVDQVCVDIARNLQKRKSGSSTGSLSSPRVFRFPKLPPNFMSSSSSESDNDPEVG
ncbi:Rho GTPase effector BNI1 [Handroanthus impetiginosus]|uniref:Formin-like protein n=1 Tax=Handroanthus impetiginosus TaxID=429701 RepID=A0A2G9HKI4_9LAMI|nr:Rho GTPase effector BNI1 [Handroanthus impetiginosus]